MCSGINYTYDEELVIPIVENTPEEKDLKVNIVTFLELSLSLLSSASSQRFISYIGV